MLKIVRGVPVAKAENAPVSAEVRENSLVLEGGNSWGFYPYKLTIPSPRMTEIVVDEGRRISGARVIATGLVGLVWKKGVHYLVIVFDWAGVQSTVVLTGTQAELAHLHGRILRARDVKGGPTDVEFTAADTPRSGSQTEYAGAIVLGLVILGVVLAIAAQQG